MDKEIARNIGDYKVALIGDPNIGIRQLLITLQEEHYPEIDFRPCIEICYPPGPISMNCTVADVSEYSKTMRTDYFRKCNDIYFVFSAIKPSSFENVKTYVQDVKDLFLSTDVNYGLICLCSEIYKDTKVVNPNADDPFDDIALHSNRSTYNIECLERSLIEPLRNDITLKLNKHYISFKMVSIAYRENILFFSPRISNFFNIFSVMPSGYGIGRESANCYSNLHKLLSANKIGGPKKDKASGVNEYKLFDIEFNSLIINFRFKTFDELNYDSGMKARNFPNVFIIPFTDKEILDDDDDVVHFERVIEKYNTMRDKLLEKYKSETQVEYEVEGGCFSFNTSVNELNKKKLTELPVVYIGFIKSELDTFKFNNMIHKITGIVNKEPDVTVIFFEKEFNHMLEDAVTYFADKKVLKKESIKFFMDAVVKSADDGNTQIMKLLK
jgi:hypothetical protein